MLSAMDVFDTHAHYDDEQFDPDRDEILSGLPQKGVKLALDPGGDIGSSKLAVSLAERYPFLYAAVGIHPGRAESMADGDIDLLAGMTGNPKVRAIGEIGLDYHYEGSPRDVQKRVFRAQLALARDLGLPVIVHDREAHGDCMEIIRSFPGLRGVLHCYSGSAEDAMTYARMGWYLSFTGVVTYKNARKVIEVIKQFPLDRMMIETDAPYLAPVPHRGRRCDSTYLHLVAEKIAEVRGLDPEEIAARTLVTGKEFFSIS
mgnify:FL=1